MRTFGGGIDADTAIEFTKKDSYIDGRNLHIGVGLHGMGGAIRPLGGNVVIPFDEPIGANTGMGCYTDDSGNTLVGFVHNSNGNHVIIWKHEDEPDARTIKVGPALGLTPGNHVAGVTLINRELLVFTDGNDYPKLININRADNTGKKAIVRLYLPHADRIVQQREYTVQLMVNGSPVGATATWSTFDSAHIRDFTPMIRDFADQFMTYGFLNSAFTATAQATYVELTATNVGEYSIQVTVRDTIASAVQPIVDCIAEYQNRYNEPFTRDQVKMSTIVPLTPPTATLGFDRSRKTSLIRSKQFQFTYGYRFKEKQRGNTSPVSDIGLPIVSVCQNTTVDYNCVDIGFADDKWLQDPAMRGEIEYIDIFMREGNNGSWYLVRSLLKHEWIYARSWRFLNDVNYTPVEQPFVDAIGTFMPPRANALALFGSVDDNQRVVFGGIEEGDPAPNVEVVAQVRLDGDITLDRGGVELTGRIIIVAYSDVTPGQAFNMNQPIITYDNGQGPQFGGMGLSSGLLFDQYTSDPQTWGQQIPLGGFLPFLDGTDLSAISQQQNIPVTVGSSGSQLSATPWIFPSGVNRGVFDGTQAGYSVNVGARTHRFAVRELMKQCHVYSTFTIGGLERGKTYSLKLASNFCDKLGGSGGIYDIDAIGKEWQNTSTRTVQVGSVTGDPNIKIGARECTITVPMTGPATIDIGNIVVLDCTNPNFIEGSFVIDGYCFDAGSSNIGAGPPDIRRQVSAERQLIRTINFNNILGGYVPFPTPTQDFSVLPPFLWPSGQDPSIFRDFIGNMFGNGAVGDAFTFTDHNGYWFSTNVNQPSHHPQAAWLGVTGDPAHPSGTFVLQTSSFYTVMNDFAGIGGSKWVGGLEGALTGPVTGDLFNGPGWQQYIMANLYPGTNIRTHIRGRVVDSTGAPVQGVRALLEGGRYVDSTPQGVIDLIAYGDVEVNQNNRMRDRLILFFPGPCPISFVAGDLIDIEIDKFEAGATYSDSPDANHYLLSPLDRVATITGAGGRAFPRGGVYLLGCYFKRDNGDPTPVQPLGKYRIPLLTEDLNTIDPLAYPVSPTFSAGVGRIDWSLIGDVPKPWMGPFVALQFCITADNTREWYLQWLASGITYSSVWDSGASTPTDVGYGGSNVTEIYIELTDSTTRYNDMHTGSLVNQTVPNTGYAWSPGDMLRILTDRNGVPRNGIVMEVEITGQRGKWLTIAVSSSIPQLFGGEVIEIFRPYKPVPASLQPYYDMPNGLVLIDNPYSATPTWSLSSGTFEWGDAWLLPTAVPILPDTSQPWKTVNVVRQSAWQSDFFASKNWGRGKAAFEIPGSTTRKRGGLMRYTNSYKPGTNINGTNLVDGDDIKVVEDWLGDIGRISSVGQELLVNCQNGSFAIYKGVEETRIDANSALLASGGILGNVRPFVHRHGTRQPMSVVQGVNTVIFYDQSNGALPQWSSNQLQDKAMQELMWSVIALKSANIGDGYVCAGYDPLNKEYLFSFPSFAYTDTGDDGLPLSVKVPAETIVYHDPSNAFIGRMDWSPDFWGNTRLKLYSFQDGKLWLHDATTTYNELGGVQRDLTVDVPVIGNVPTSVKVLDTVWLSRGDTIQSPGWDVERVTNIDGQRSFIPETFFTMLEGKVVKGAFLNDAVSAQQRDPGDQMRSTSFVVRLRHQGPKLVHLVWAKFGYDASDDTTESNG